jgi:hypothetical protein
MFVTGLISPTVVSFAFSTGSAMISVLDEQKRVLDLLLRFPPRRSAHLGSSMAAVLVGQANP